MRGTRGPLLTISLRPNRVIRAFSGGRRRPAWRRGLGGVGAAVARLWWPGGELLAGSGSRRWRGGRAEEVQQRGDDALVGVFLEVMPGVGEAQDVCVGEGLEP